jgi:hypothetical protein
VDADHLACLDQNPLMADIIGWIIAIAFMAWIIYVATGR